MWKRCLLLWWALVLAAGAAPPLSQGWFRGRVVTFEVRDGLAIAEGDIVLGEAAVLEEALRRSVAGPGKGQPPEASAILDDVRLWPQGVIPYVIDEDIPNQARITGAIAHWNEVSGLRLQPRHTEANYVRFRRVQADGVCSSSVGMVGGAQSINTDDRCSLGTMVHEIGHAAGLWHEQSRNDRDAWVRVRYENIQSGYAGQFDQRLTNGRDIGPYDYASVMHYSSGAFSNGRGATLESLPHGIPFGQRSTLSASDIYALRRLYGLPLRYVVTTNPEGLPITVDGVAYTSPQQFDWAPASSHRISVPELIEETRSRLRFARWSNYGSRTQEVVAPAQPVVWLASYAREFLITVAAQPPEGGAVSLNPPASGNFFPLGAPVTLTALPAPGWHFTGWSFPGGRELGATGANPITISAAAYNVTAVFSPATPTVITTDPPGLRVTVDGVARLTPYLAAWAPGSSHTLFVEETIVPTGATRTRHRFLGWSDDGARERSITAGAPTTYTARFTTEYKPEITVTPRQGGAVGIEPPSADGYYEAGAVVQLRATPSPGLGFLGWSGLAASGPVARLTIQQEHAITAAFAVPGALMAANVLHAALLKPGPVSPGGILSLFGVDIGPAEEQGALVAGGLLEKQLGDTRVFFDGVPAPLLYASPRQINAIAPYAISGRARTTLTVESRGTRKGPLELLVWPARAGIFTWDDTRAAALNEDYTLNSPSQPAPRGSVVVFWVTGEGLMEPPPPDGLVYQDRPARPALPVFALIDGIQAVVEYAGGAPGMVAGVMQVNVRIPRNASAGERISLALQVGESACAATLSLR